VQLFDADVLLEAARMHLACVSCAVLCRFHLCCDVLRCAVLLQVVKVLNLEEGGAFTVSSADAIMEALG
jgi:hypothetical protein